MPITFGSVGDTIAVGQIAWSLAQALTDSKGSAKEYQSLVKELRAFERALLQIVALWQNYDCPDVITTDVVKDWLDTLRVFQEKVNKKYGVGLGGSGSGNWAKDVSKKIIWLKEKEDIVDLRRKLSSASDTITMLTLAAMGKSNKLAESAITFRVQAVHSMLEDSKRRAEKQAAQIKAMDEKIDVQSKMVDLILCNVQSGNASLTQVHSMTVDIKNMLYLFQNYIESQQSTPRGLGTGWQQNPILNVILLERFENHPGHRKVLKGEFVIEDAVTGRDLNRETKLTMCFRPGQKVNMSMVFSEVDDDANYCPRCGTPSVALAEARSQCTTCRMWFQRLVEIDDDPEPEPILQSTEVPGAVRSGERTEKRKILVSTPGDFKRVRLMSILSLKEKMAKEARDKAYAKGLEEGLSKADLGEENAWDLALDALRGRKAWKQAVDRLRAAGFTEEEVLKEELDFKSQGQLPNYRRLSRRYLSLETLNRCRIHYELEDLDGVLINHWVPDYERNFLWDHTSKLREARKGNQREGISSTKGSQTISNSLVSNT
ncbi:hypothetical protein EG329_010679 [Mollisiaceae sp. DMI_Dod_QoI]|nr:hypothetical protein EG329_010679 [Helotiales sp. DMI_Dod_QoI]